MAKKIFGMGMLVIVLVFSMTVSSCGGKDVTVTVTGIPDTFIGSEWKVALRLEWNDITDPVPVTGSSMTFSFDRWHADVVWEEIRLSFYSNGALVAIYSIENKLTPAGNSIIPFSDFEKKEL